MSDLSDESVRRIVEEATKESLNQSFTEAGRKYIQAAQVSEQKGDLQGADKLYAQAADAFLQAAEKYRASKSYKNAALNMCAAGDLYSDLAEAEKAMQTYRIAADDLLKASSEHFLWGDDAETKKGTALAVVASMIYIMIGQEDVAFASARKFVAQNASKLMFPLTVRLSQIPQLLETSISSVDISMFSAAETAAVTELKAALNSANAQEFVKYVDKGLDMVREILRGKLKVPKLETRLELPVDSTFKETIPLKVVISNTGDGDALGLSAEWFVDEGLSHVSGDKKKTMQSLRAGSSLTGEIRVKSTQPDLMGTKEYQIMVRGAYSDMLQTEYSLQAGPGSLVVRDFKMTEKLLHDVDITDTRVGLLNTTIESSQFEKQPLLRVTSSLASSLKKARDEIRNKELEAARARIGVVNEMVEALDSLAGDDELAELVKSQRESEKRAYARSMIDPIHTSLGKVIAQHQKALEDGTRTALAEWDSQALKKKELSTMVRESHVGISDLLRELESLYSQMPQASSTDNPEEAARRTKLRSWVDGLKSKTQVLNTKLGAMASNPLLSTGARPAVPDKVELAARILKSVNDDLGRVVQSKKAELG